MSLEKGLSAVSDVPTNFKKSDVLSTARVLAFIRFCMHRSNKNSLQDCKSGARSKPKLCCQRHGGIQLLQPPSHKSHNLRSNPGHTKS
eukprot:2096078-Rhodomonas_salina.1